MFTITRITRIEWGDCDPAGIIYYPRYFEIFDASTHRLFEGALGMPHFDMLKAYDFAGLPMVDTRAKFHATTRFGDDVTVESTIAEFRNTSFDVRHRLLKGAELAVEGFETRVWVGRHPSDPDAFKARRIPDTVREAFEKR